MESKKTDEIDLIDLLASFFITIKQYLGLILIMGTVGLGLGFAFAKTAPDLYVNRMSMSSDILTYSYATQLIENLNYLCRDGNYQEVARKLNMSERQVSNIAELKVESAIENQTIIPEAEKKYFVVATELRTQSILDSLQTGLVYFFENNEYMKARAKQRRHGLQYIIDGIDTEIASLMELKKRIYSGELFESAKSNLTLDPATLNVEIVKLKKERVVAEESLQLANSVHVIEGFAPFTKPKNDQKFLTTFLGGLIGGILAFLIIGIKSLLKTIKEQQSLQS